MSGAQSVTPFFLEVVAESRTLPDIASCVTTSHQIVWNDVFWDDDALLKFAQFFLLILGEVGVKKAASRPQ